MATMMVLSTIIEELDGELALFQAAVGEGVSSAILSNEDVPKLKEFVGTKSECDVDNILCRIENYFHAKGITDDVVKVNITSMFLTNIALLWWRDVIEKESLLAFSEWTETMGQTIVGTKRCLKAVESHNGSGIYGQA
ncbi:hypothetical protein J1N35_044099 [Gossypium stocksii]|uniref:Retrotransposon gag domain-containing protein n=1 Tax=Gossypium stocksii TaxID=47602 RepID=A0A9D3ZFP7_9ROSI|nr:hypothetical protein J1N35_044099 [Gossypium stocksii]